MTASFLLGLLGSLGHCVGMCSAVIILFDRQPIFQNKLAWVLAHAGRITTYSILGLSSARLVKPSGLSTAFKPRSPFSLQSSPFTWHPHLLD
jgi:sulfite exporter TauE/SafE